MWVAGVCGGGGMKCFKFNNLPFFFSQIILLIHLLIELCHIVLEICIHGLFYFKGQLCQTSSLAEKQ